MNEQNYETEIENCHIGHIWIIALLLEKSEPGRVQFLQTISWRQCESKEEAIGQAVIFAATNNPDFSVKMYTVAKIELPNKELPK
jgi:hypothetical protein